MKRLFTVFAAMMMMAFGLKAQTPAVAITVDEVTPTTVTASFAMNESCVKYTYMLSEASEMQMWAAMYGVGLERLVREWGITKTADETYTWDEQVPNTEYTIYVLAYSATDSVLYTELATTSSNGGSGQSVIDIQVSEITATTARVVCTPNDQTAVFYDQLILKDFYDAIGPDSALAIVKDSPYPMYETDNWVWSDLDPNTEIYVLAIGQNAEGQWGGLAMQLFRTLEGNGIERVEKGRISIYPNPATEQVTINLNGLHAQQVAVYDLAGRKVMQQSVEQNAEAVSMDIQSLRAGTYMVSVSSKGALLHTEKLIVR